MTIRFFPKPECYSSTSQPPSVTLVYGLTGEDNNTIVRDYVFNALPLLVSTIQGVMQRGNIQIDPEGHRLWRITCPYGPLGQSSQQTGGPNLQPGQWTFSFDTTGGTRHITNVGQARFGVHIASFKAAGWAGAIPNHKGAIGVNLGDDRRIEGVDVHASALRFQITFCHPQGDITAAKMATLAEYTGFVNADVFFTFKAGEVLFLGASGSDGSQADATVTYQFEVSKELKNFNIGDIAVTNKQGWDYLWVEHQLAVDAERATAPALFAHIERVYPRMAFVPFFGFGN